MTQSLSCSHASLPVPFRGISSEELLEAFLSGKSPKTVEAYRRDLEDFRLFLGAPDMSAAAHSFLSGELHRANYVALKYKTFLVEEKKLQPTTVNQKLAALRSLTEMAYTLGMINWNVRVKNQKVSSDFRDKRGPGKSGIERLREEASKHPTPKV